MKTGLNRLIVAVMAAIVLFSGIGLKKLEVNSVSLSAENSPQTASFARPSFDYSYAKSCTGSTITGMQGVIRIVQRITNNLNSRISLELLPVQELLPCLFVLLTTVILYGNQPRKREIAVLQYIHGQDGKK